MEIKQLYRVAYAFLNSRITCFLNSFQYIKWHNWIGDKHEMDLSTSIKFNSQLSACSKQIYLHCTAVWKIYLISSFSKCKTFPSVTQVLSCRMGTHPGKCHLQRAHTGKPQWGWSTQLWDQQDPSVHHQSPKDPLSLTPFLFPPHKLLVPFPTPHGCFDLWPLCSYHHFSERPFYSLLHCECISCWLQLSWCIFC